MGQDCSIQVPQDCVIWNSRIDERTKISWHTLDQFLLYIFSKDFQSAHKLTIYKNESLFNLDIFVYCVMLTAYVICIS